jgi:1-deoxyxylulose-5-phosphate synthase
VKVSKVCLGTATLGVARVRSRACGPCAALDLGHQLLRHRQRLRGDPTFDRPDAPPATEREPAEQLLGRALVRDVVIATKSVERRFDPAAGLSRRYIIHQVEHSLRRLGTNYIDLYYAHFPDFVTPLEQTLVVYDDLVRQGKLRYVALSNHPARQVTQELWIAGGRHLSAAPVCAQVKYNLIGRSAEGEPAPASQQFGLSIVPFGPLHGGLLAGMPVEERKCSGDKRFGVSGFTDTELEIGRAVERLSQEWGLQSYQVSLAWLLSRPAGRLGDRGRGNCRGVHHQRHLGRRHLGPGPARRLDCTASGQGQLNETAPCQDGVEGAPQAADPLTLLLRFRSPSVRRAIKRFCQRGCAARAR